MRTLIHNLLLLRKNSQGLLNKKPSSSCVQEQGMTESLISGNVCLQFDQDYGRWLMMIMEHHVNLTAAKREEVECMPDPVVASTYSLSKVDLLKELEYENKQATSMLQVITGQSPLLAQTLSDLREQQAAMQAMKERPHVIH